jgi:hypothetical protein
MRFRPLDRLRTIGSKLTPGLFSHAAISCGFENFHRPPLIFSDQIYFNLDHVTDLDPSEPPSGPDAPIFVRQMFAHAVEMFAAELEARKARDAQEAVIFGSFSGWARLLALPDEFASIPCGLVAG